MTASYNEIKKFYGENAKSDHIENWNGLEIRLHPTLTLEESLKFVHEVVYSCFERGTGEYLPEIRDFAMKCSVLERYANIELPEDAADKYDLVYNTDLYEFVSEKINLTQFFELEEAIDRKVNHLADNKSIESDGAFDEKKLVEAFIEVANGNGNKD